MRRAFLAFLALAAVVCSPNVSAGDDRKELTPFIGYRSGGEFRSYNTGQEFDVASAETYGFTFDFPTSDETKVEFLYNRQETEIKTNGFFGTDRVPLDIEYFHIGAMYQPSPDEDLQPYVVGSLGATHMDPKGETGSSETGFSFSLGGGLKYFFSRNIGIRIEGRLYGTLTNGGGAIFCGGGCTFAFSGNAFWQIEANAGLIIAF